ncbi:nitrate reductase molybdenum cofactor assembly chaperone [Heyndrickxia ginsengihumi]|uniref:Nitrate reductase n=1 Tax=Heyndrickxia ginsengihumi TaxID=363870 RepID=A0A0A6VCN8_9BACI|nr:nitrate reductase molybdenum cofactor assembly chaperone [Heyndrickxia ginsengihumi]KHD85258.1 nitrate reductase [Heyndrickxia ginsengihumi]MBE6184547.1 nitrate reductase molybdenum cofactor assembly chaperone [Bacillus sp. (in: firmicutes)]MCM3024502.1 nitrate reductase molybdenum cofactor assembly chaperone [Heyndrickxia ginsengihumi]
MKYQEVQNVLEIVSYLLSYPDRGWQEGLNECLNILDDLQDEQIVQDLKQFIEKVQTQDKDRFIESYVYTFDFGKKTNMYLTYMVTGEQRERGMELLDLKQIYQSAGFAVTDKELPDYLPLMLEIAAQAEEQYTVQLLHRYTDNIAEIHQQLQTMESEYAIVFTILLQVIHELTNDNVVEGIG